jgi:alkylation response protein AidB-like acyl-CoA dehydrogenase
MNWDLPERLPPLLQKTRAFLSEELYPLEQDFLRKRFREMQPVLEQKRQHTKKLGLWTPPLPKEYGGLGLSLAEFAYLSEEMGRTPLGHFVFNCQAPDIGNMELLLAHGSDEQKQTYLLPLIRGEIRSCFSMTEPEFPGSNPTWMSTTAVKDGDDYVINGHKWFTSSAEGAAFAIVMAITNPEAASSHQRASQIIVPTNTPGFKLVRNISVMGHAGEDYASHGEIIYENCRVPQKNLLGQEGSGFAMAQERLGPGRIHHCMRWVGICERAFEMMCEYAVKRRLAPNKPLAASEVIQTWVAESRAEINAARLMVLHTAHKIDRDGSHAARDDISLIKFFVANVLQKALDRAIQVHGGLGVTDDTLLAYWYRQERAARIYDGPDEVHKIAVAKRILRKYGFENF